MVVPVGSLKKRRLKFATGAIPGVTTILLMVLIVSHCRVTVLVKCIMLIAIGGCWAEWSALGSTCLAGEGKGGS